MLKPDQSLSDYIAESQRNAAIDKEALHTLGEPVIIVDEDGYIVRINGDAQRFTGWSPLDILGRTIEESCIPERLREKHKEHRIRYQKYPVNKQMGSRFDYHLVLLNRRGEEKPVTISLSPFMVESSTYYSAVIRLRDEVRG